MTLKQVELMCADCSITVYPKSDTVKDGKGKEHKFNRPSTSSIKELQKQYESWSDVNNATFDLSGFSFK